MDDEFVTLSGRTISLRIFVEPKDLDKCDHAMLSLKNAMYLRKEREGRQEQNKGLSEQREMRVLETLKKDLRLTELPRQIDDIIRDELDEPAGYANGPARVDEDEPDEDKR